MKFPEQCRIRTGQHKTTTGSDYGAFILSGTPSCRKLNVIACAAHTRPEGDSEEVFGELLDWDHVSVSVHGKPFALPTWDEMCRVKNTFWDREECVVQFHPPEKDYVNIGQVLHLWKHKDGHITPPNVMV